MTTNWTRISCLIITIVAIAGFATAQAPLTCGDIGDPGFLLGQNSHDPLDPDADMMSSHQATWSTYLMAENVLQSADPDWFDVSSLTVWGLSLVSDGGIAECDPTGITFAVAFFEDSASQPGTVICGPQSVPAAITSTGLQFSGFDIYQFDLTVACDLGSVGPKWVTVQSELNPADCGFIWVSGTGGDGISMQDAGSGWFSRDNDRSICINGATVPVELTNLSIE